MEEILEFRKKLVLPLLEKFGVVKKSHNKVTLVVVDTIVEQTVNQ